MSSRRAVFLDLNGTLVLPVMIERLSQLEPIAGGSRAVSQLCAAGFACPVVTIQSRIAKGYFSESDFAAWFQAFAGGFAKDGAVLLGPYVCPHRFSYPCACRKPSTLLYERAAADHGIDLAQSFVVGDSAADIEAARRFGGRGCFVKTGSGEGEQELARVAPYAAHVAPSVVEAADWILQFTAGSK